ncbi:MAG TPA: archaeosine biosynthesis radical SAM protein RaSEA [Candidatus Thermoplasmatota archaeon]|nr:archaeosine biosynthesis radical SAM protein RaSEA [Candidatus Thermoplasmatota archaeon]
MTEVYFKPLAKASRDARRLEVKTGDPSVPSSIFTQPDRYDGEEVTARVVILRTRGCRWALTGGCTFCGYVNDSFVRKIDGAELVAQWENALQSYAGEPILKIYTSGSFFDPYEVPEEAQKAILANMPEGLKKLNVESQAVDITEKRMELVMSSFPKDRVKLEIGVGLEAANYEVARYSVNKEFFMEDYRKAAAVAKQHGATLKAYTMVKPPFLTEREAIESAVETAREAGPHSSTISFNPMNIQKNTLVDKLWKRGQYRPPWLWSVVEILKRGKQVTDTVVKSDPVAGGKVRGSHNCGKCDEYVLAAIRDFNVHQNPKVFDRLKCDCKKVWEDVLELEGMFQGPMGRWDDPMRNSEDDD